MGEPTPATDSETLERIKLFLNDVHELASKNMERTCKEAGELIGQEYLAIEDVFPNKEQGIIWRHGQLNGMLHMHRSLERLLERADDSSLND